MFGRRPIGYIYKEIHPSGRSARWIDLDPGGQTSAECVEITLEYDIYRDEVIGYTFPIFGKEIWNETREKRTVVARTTNGEDFYTEKGKVPDHFQVLPHLRDAYENFVETNEDYWKMEYLWG